MNNDASRIYGYTFISRQKFSADANPSSTLFIKARCCLFLSSKNAFRSYLMIFKCASAIMVTLLK